MSTDMATGTNNRVIKGGDAPDLTGMSNFLATDKVPDTLFGIPVISRREDYTEADLRFFKDHPEAGGYYDMGEETPEDGSAEGAPVQNDEGGITKKSYGLRNDGKTFKGSGWLGELKLPDGSVATEYSVGVNIDGEELDIPTLVPTLTESEVATMVTDIIPGKKQVPAAIMEKAVKHAKDRIITGESVWANDGDPEANLRWLWDRAKASTGGGDMLAKVFGAMSGEQTLRENGVSPEAIINTHLAKLLVHQNETNRMRNNPANDDFKDTFSNFATLENGSNVLKGYKWGSGPATNFTDTVKNEPRFSQIARSPSETMVAIALIQNAARFLNGDLKLNGLLPEDAVSYGDGAGAFRRKNGKVDTEDISADEIKFKGGLVPGFRIGRRKKGTRK